MHLSKEVCLGYLVETSMLDSQPINTPMDPNVELVSGQEKPLEDP